ncbi:hypothetical protein [Comamonas antarctica]|uniref:Uncharacterized protein n=1 Tax=Comamonas antarctica TaxID=2743470 RepID=A0A6N1X539_9BURK|nr:hypothetical protein [Comamonas antarctica]QKV53413.1 hypothetical protein HUK68_11205 [Comamonas antarctica]
MKAFPSVSRHPLVAFAVTVVLAISSMGSMLWIDNAAQAADSLQVVDLFTLLEE